MKVAMCQVNPMVGDLSGNLKLVLDQINQAIYSDCNVILFPENMTVGYPARDYLLDQSLWLSQMDFVDRVLEHIKSLNQNVTVILGGLHESRENTHSGPFSKYNSAYIIDPEFGIRIVNKRLLPRYDVFQETRYFVEDESKPETILIRDGDKLVPCDVLICEDIWNFDQECSSWMNPFSYTRNPVMDLSGTGPLFVINASPFWHKKVEKTINLVQRISKKLNRVVFWCNQVGANDDVVFGGYSMCAFPDWSLRVGNLFKEDMVIVNPSEPSKYKSFMPEDKIGGRIISPEDFEDYCTFQAISLFVKDYYRKCNFTGGVVLGVSGGIDSALVAVIAAHALGSDLVHGVALPSEFSSEHSVEDARQLMYNLGGKLSIIQINELHSAARNSLLSASKQKFNNPVTDENLQPRLRMSVLMGISNENGSLLLNTGNKSEISVGYCTLYGDLSGGIAVISDLWKTEVIRLCKFYNKYFGNIIPESIINKKPSAELRPDQFDSDSLPPYEVLDPILIDIVERENHVPLTGKDPVRNKIVKLYRNSEFKRQQLPRGCKLTERAFGSGRHMPIAAKRTFVSITPPTRGGDCS